MVGLKNLKFKLGDKVTTGGKVLRHYRDSVEDKEEFDNYIVKFSFYNRTVDFQRWDKYNSSTIFTVIGIRELRDGEVRDYTKNGTLKKFQYKAIGRFVTTKCNLVLQLKENIEDKQTINCFPTQVRKWNETTNSNTSNEESEKAATYRLCRWIR